MPILYVNPSGRRKKRFAFGKAVHRKRKKSGAKRKGRMPKALAAYWAKKRSKKKSRRKATVTRRRRRKAKAAGSSKMAKRKKSRSRRRGRKRSKKSYARAARLGIRRRKRKSSGGKRRRSRRKRSKSRRRRSRRRSRKSRARAAKLGIRRRKRKMHGPVFRRSKAGRGGTMRGHGPITFVKPNPSRRRKRKSTRRRGRRTAARLGWRRRRRKSGSRRRRSRSRSGKRRRRYKRFGRLRGRTVYVRNPGQMLIQLAKRAVPIVLATIGSKMIASKVGTRIPMLDRLGQFQGPVVSILTVLGLNFATKKISFLAKHRDAILMGAAIAAVHETISALAPASVKGMLGMGDTYTQALADYVATNDYEQVADGMSDYVATGDFEQEMGLDQEMGFTQELAGDLGPFGQSGLGGARGFAAPVPTQRFLAPVPTHSFTGPVPEMTDEYDNPKMLYTGVFSK